VLCASIKTRKKRYESAKTQESSPKRLNNAKMRPGKPTTSHQTKVPWPQQQPYIDQHTQIMNDQSEDNLAQNEVKQKLVMELRRQYGLADNPYGNKIIAKVVDQSNNSITKARTILPRYIKEMKCTYSKGFDELIILEFMDDREIGRDEKRAANEQTQINQREVPSIIAYMESNQYRPKLE